MHVFSVVFAVLTFRLVAVLLRSVFPHSADFFSLHFVALVTAGETSHGFQSLHEALGIVISCGVSEHRPLSWRRSVLGHGCYAGSFGR